MTHYTVTVALPGKTPASELKEALDTVLAPYNESLRVQPYVSQKRSEVLVELDRYNPGWRDRYSSEDHAVRSWSGGDLSPEGDVLSTYNPHSRWDWYKVGGRWPGMWTLKPGGEAGLPTDPSWCNEEEERAPGSTDCARLSALEPESIRPCTAYLDLDGQWNEDGKVGWFGTSSADLSELGIKRWNKKFFEWVSSLDSDTWLINVDCHI